MTSTYKPKRKWFAYYRKRTNRNRLGGLQSIVFKLEKGEISVQDAYDEVQKSDRAQHSRLDQFLETIVG